MNDIDRLVRIYSVAGRELRRMVLAVDPMSYSLVAAEAARTRSRELARMMNMAVEGWAESAIRRSYKKGERTARTALEILGKRPVRPAIEDKAKRIIDDTLVLLVRANNSIPATVDKYLTIVALAARTTKTAALQEFSFSDAEAELGAKAVEAVAKEKSRGWLMAQVREWLQALIEDDEFIEINGRMYRMRKYAELVARTTMREAQTAATESLCHQYDNDLVVISSHGCDCDICEPYEGNVYSLSGRSMKYPLLEKKPPFHPNCKHSMHPTTARAEELNKEYGETDLDRQIREAKEAGLWRNVR